MEQQELNIDKPKTKRIRLPREEHEQIIAALVEWHRSGRPLPDMTTLAAHFTVVLKRPEGRPVTPWHIKADLDEASIKCGVKLEVPFAPPPGCAPASLLPQDDGEVEALRAALASAQEQLAAKDEELEATRKELVAAQEASCAELRRLYDLAVAVVTGCEQRHHTVRQAVDDSLKYDDTAPKTLQIEIQKSMKKFA